MGEAEWCPGSLGTRLSRSFATLGVLEVRVCLNCRVVFGWQGFLQVQLAEEEKGHSWQGELGGQRPGGRKVQGVFGSFNVM